MQQLEWVHYSGYQGPEKNNYAYQSLLMIKVRLSDESRGGAASGSSRNESSASGLLSCRTNLGWGGTSNSIPWGGGKTSNGSTKGNGSRTPVGLSWRRSSVCRGSCSPSLPEREKSLQDDSPSPWKKSTLWKKSAARLRHPLSWLDDKSAEISPGLLTVDLSFWEPSLAWLALESSLALRRSVR